MKPFVWFYSVIRPAWYDEDHWVLDGSSAPEGQETFWYRASVPVKGE